MATVAVMRCQMVLLNKQGCYWGKTVHVCVPLAGREHMTMKDRMKGGGMKLARLYAGPAAAGAGREGARERKVCERGEGEGWRETTAFVWRGFGAWLALTPEDCCHHLEDCTHNSQVQASLIFSLIHSPQFSLTDSFHNQTSLRKKPCVRGTERKTYIICNIWYTTWSGTGTTVQGFKDSINTTFQLYTGKWKVFFSQWY